MKIPRWMKRFFPKSWYRRWRKRICARCQQPIKKRERWSAVMWADGRPRHLSGPCAKVEKSLLGTSGETVRIIEAE